MAFASPTLSAPLLHRLHRWGGLLATGLAIFLAGGFLA